MANTLCLRGQTRLVSSLICGDGTIYASQYIIYLYITNGHYIIFAIDLYNKSKLRSPLCNCGIKITQY